MVSKPGQDSSKPAGPTGKASWRSGRTAKSRKDYAWQEGAAAKTNQATQRRNFMRRFMVAGLALVFVGLCIYFFIVTFRKPLKVPLVVMAVTNYDLSSIPPNAFASEDLARLQQLGDGEMFAVQSDADVSSERDSILAFLKQQLDVRPGGPDRNTVVIYLSAHGVVGYPDRDSAQGRSGPPGFDKPQPCLMFAGSDALDSSNWVPLSEVLAVLGEYQPRETNKLLILDCGRIDANWRLGQLYNGFADLLPEAVRAAEVPGLVVVNSTSPGQKAWSAPELNASAFGHFVSLGLAGAANESPYGDGDSSVSVQELQSYLGAVVPQWSRSYRSQVQEPLFVSSSGTLPDFAIAFVTPYDFRPTTSSVASSSSRWSEVESLWQRHAELLRAGAPGIDPLTWETYQSALLRLEELLQSGTAYADRIDPQSREVERLAQQLGAVIDLDLPAINFPIAKRFGTQREPGSSRAAAADASQDDSKASYWRTAAALWQQASSKSGVNKSQLSSELRGLDKAKDKPAIEPVEIHFLRMLEAYLDPTVVQTSPGLLQQALAARDAAENASVPYDPRVQYAAYESVAKADADRRAAEDKLFVGSPESLSQAAQLWTVSQKRFSQAEQRAKDLTAAYELRDRVYRELPYLIPWTMHRAGFNALAGKELAAIVADVHQLAGLLERSAVEEVDTEITELRKSLHRRVAEIERQFQDECDSLRSVAAPSAENLFRMSAVLATPLLTGFERNELRTRYLSILARSEELPQTESSDVNAKSEEGDQDHKTPIQLARLKMNGHPAIALLSRQSVDSSLANPYNAYVAETLYGKSDDELARLDNSTWVQALSAQGEQVRQMLIELPTEVERQSGLAEESPAEAGSAAIAARAGRSRADRLLRAAAPIKGEGPWSAKQNDPIRELRQLDLHNLLVWHARRAIDDFWDSLESSTQPYFERVAGTCLDQARKLAPEGKGITAPVYALLKERAAAAQTGLTPKPQNMLFAEGDTRREHQVPIAWPDDLPSGEAAYFVRGEQSGSVPLSTRSGPANRLAVALKETAAEQELRYDLPRSGLAESGSTFQAAVLYRGHLFPRPFEATPVGRGIEIVHVPSEYVDPKITVEGDLRKRSGIVFVFDCSGSMGGAVFQDRFVPARDAFEAILRSLNEKYFDVGVILYGHRAGWQRVGNKYVAKPKKPAYEGINPGQDVERVLRLGRFGAREKASILKTLGEVGPFGQTPLYLAIFEAVDELKSFEGKGVRRIIVLTDGLNEQDDAGDKTRTRQQVQALFEDPKNKDIRLDVIGLNVRADPTKPDQANDLQFLKRLPRDTRGDYYDINKHTDLLDALEKSLGISQFEVYRGRERIGEPKELGATVRIEDRPSSRKERYTVKLVDRQRPAETSFDLEGGEAIQLVVSEDSGRRELVHQRYKRPARDVVQDNIPDPDPASDRKLYIAAHLPEVDGNLVRFEISLQDHDPRKLLPRPAEAWIEVRPVRPDSSQPNRNQFHFYDMKFVADRPVPVLGCDIPDWPDSDAEIRIWTKMEKTPPDESVLVSQQWNREFELPAIPNVKFKLQIKPGDPLGVEITETHSASSELYSLKVEMDHRADKIVHSYNPEIRSATHTFYFRHGDESLIRDYQAMFTSRAKLMENAITTPEPLIRTIPIR